VTDFSVDGLVKKGFIHSNRSEYWPGLSLLLFREASLLRIENKLGKDGKNPGLDQCDVTIKTQR
jgi:hypothetical protein